MENWFGGRAEERPPWRRSISCSVFVVFKLNVANRRTSAASALKSCVRTWNSGALASPLSPTARSECRRRLIDRFARAHAIDHGNLIFTLITGPAEVTLGERREQLGLDVVEIDREQGVRKILGGWRRWPRVLAHEKHWRRNNERRDRFPDRRGKPANHQRRSVGVLRLDGQPRLPVGHRGGPFRGDQRSRGGIELLKREHIRFAARRDVEILDESRRRRCRVPAIVAIGKPCARILIGARNIGLKEQIGSRQLAIEVLCKLSRLLVERAAQTFALRFADPPKPDVLQRGEQQDEGQQRHRED